MYENSSLDEKLATAAWGLLFVFWGISMFFDRIPFGAGLLGTGIILLGLNGVRVALAIETKGLTTGCGVLTLVWGMLELMRTNMRLPFELNDWAVFSILLMVLGLMMLWDVIRAGGRRNAKGPGSEA